MWCWGCSIAWNPYRVRYCFGPTGFLYLCKIVHKNLGFGVKTLSFEREFEHTAGLSHSDDRLNAVLPLLTTDGVFCISRVNVHYAYRVYEIILCDQHVDYRL